MARLFAPRKPEPVVEPEKPKETPPIDVKAIVTEAVTGIAGQFNETLGRLSTKVEELASRQPQVVVQAAEQRTVRADPDISDQEIDNAVLQGQGAASRIRALVDRAVTRATERVINEHVRPLQEYGVNAIGELSRRVTVEKMPHYNRFKKEIDSQLATLTPDVRSNPTVIETVYNAVVGRNADALAREAAEAAVRQAQDEAAGKGKDKTVTPGTGAGGDPGARGEDNRLPDAANFGGDEGVAALSHKGKGGQSQDDFARGMGYADWNDYMKQYNQLLKENEGI